MLIKSKNSASISKRLSLKLGITNYVNYIYIYWSITNIYSKYYALVLLISFRIKKDRFSLIFLQKLISFLWCVDLLKMIRKEWKEWIELLEWNILSVYLPFKWYLKGISLGDQKLSLNKTNDVFFTTKFRRESVRYDLSWPFPSYNEMNKTSRWINEDRHLHATCHPLLQIPLLPPLSRLLRLTRHCQFLLMFMSSFYDLFLTIHEITMHVFDSLLVYFLWKS